MDLINLPVRLLTEAGEPLGLEEGGGALVVRFVAVPLPPSFLVPRGQDLFVVEAEPNTLSVPDGGERLHSQSRGSPMSYDFTANIRDPFDEDIASMDFTAWLLEGETISGDPVIAVTPEGLTIGDIVAGAGLVSWRVSGGDLGRDYIVSVSIVTSLDRRRKRSVLYRVRAR